MSAPSTAMKPAVAAAPSRPSRPGKRAGGADLTRGTDRATQRLAAAILEVLAGARTPAQAAEALGRSLPAYYQREAQALRGLLAGCQPRPKGRTPDKDAALATLRQERDRLERALARQQALVRLVQRTTGLSAAPAAAPKAKGKRRRQPAARAAAVAARLRQEAETATAGAGAAAAGAAS